MTTVENIAAALADIYSGPVPTGEVEAVLDRWADRDPAGQAPKFVEWWHKQASEKLHTLRPFENWLERVDLLPEPNGRRPLTDAEVAERIRRWRESPYGLPAAIHEMQADGVPEPEIRLSAEDLTADYEAALRERR